MQIESIAKIIGLISALVALPFAARKLYRYFKPIKVEPGFNYFFSEHEPSEVLCRITNLSHEAQYIVSCEAKGMNSYKYIFKKHLKKPLTAPRLYPCIWFGANSFRFIGENAQKIEPFQPINLEHKISGENWLSAMLNPYFIIEVKLSSGKVVRSKRMPTPLHWQKIGLHSQRA